MFKSQIVEYIFFFGFMGVVAYLTWQMLTPFVSALALAAIIVTICYPLYEMVRTYLPIKNDSIAALLTTIIVIFVVIFPFFFLISSLVNETVEVYSVVDKSSVGYEETLSQLELTLDKYIPGIELDLVQYIRQAASWLASKSGAIFAGTASTVFSFFIAMIGSFYLFRDGKAFTLKLIEISPLPKSQDELILSRLAKAVRSVALGTVFVALVQGFLTAVGFYIFGFERAIMIGTIAAFGALIPSVGTAIVFVPGVIYLILSSNFTLAIGLIVWGVLAVGLVDNLLGPYLMSRGSTLHPFVILLSVLGGISLFGPIGFIVGPVVTSLLVVLLELYSVHMPHEPEVKNEEDDDQSVIL